MEPLINVLKAIEQGPARDNIVFGVRRYRDPVGPISVLQPGDLQSVEEVLHMYWSKSFI